MNEPADSINQIRRTLAASPNGNKAAGVALYSYGATRAGTPEDSSTPPRSARSLVRPRRHWPGQRRPAALRNPDLPASHRGQSRSNRQHCPVREHRRSPDRRPRRSHWLTLPLQPP